MKIKNYKKNRRRLLFSGSDIGPLRKLPRRLANWRKVFFSNLTLNGKPLGITLGLVVLLAGLAPTLQAGTLHKLRFTRVDGTVWECLTTVPNPETPVAVATNAPGYTVGSHTNYSGGHTFWIQDGSIYDEQGPLGKVEWAGYPYPYQFDGHYGFCIDHAGQGWFAGTLVGDNQCLLFKLNIYTGNLTFVDYLDLNGWDNIFVVNSAVMVEGP